MFRNSFISISLVFISLGVFASSSAHADFDMKPGRWQVSRKTVINGVDMSAKYGGLGGRAYQCVSTPDEATAQAALKKTKHSIAEGRGKCTFFDERADDTGYGFKYQCSGVAGSGKGEGEMTFSLKDSTHYRFDSLTIMEGAMPNMPPATGKNKGKTVTRFALQGNWVSAQCQPGDDREDND